MNAKYFITEILFVGETGRGGRGKIFLGYDVFFIKKFLGEGGTFRKIFFDDGV